MWKVTDFSFNKYFFNAQITSHVLLLFLEYNAAFYQTDEESFVCQAGNVKYII